MALYFVSFTGFSFSGVVLVIPKLFLLGMCLRVAKKQLIISAYQYDYAGMKKDRMWGWREKYGLENRMKEEAEGGLWPVLICSRKRMGIGEEGRPSKVGE